MAKQKPTAARKNEPTATQKPKKTTPNESFFQKNGRLLVVLLAVVGLTFLAYQPALQNDFTNWDDPTYVTENSLLLNPTAENNAALWREPVSLNFHPLTMQSLKWNFDPKKPSARPFILTNIGLHLLNTALVFGLCFYLSRRRLEVAALAALLFGIHPMHVESVAWISERKDVLYGFFFLASLLTYLRFVRRGGIGWLAVTFVLFIASCLSKAMAVCLPVVLLLFDFYENRLFSNGKISWKVVVEKIPFLAASVYFGLKAVEIQSHGAIASTEVFTFIQRLVFASYGFVMYLWKFFAPYPLVTFYDYPIESKTGGAPAFFYAMPLIVIAIFTIAFLKLRTTKLFVFSIGFYFLTVALVLQFVSVGVVIMADRYTYLPYVGLLFLGAMGFSEIWKNEQSRLRMPVVAAVGIFSAAMFFITRQQVGVWKNSETLWTNVLKFYPNTTEAYKSRGNFKGKTGRIDEALDDLKRAAELGSTAAGVFTGLGNSYGTKGNFNAALDAFTKGIEFNPSNAELFLNRGITHEMMKNHAAAISDYNAALAADPARKLQILGPRGYAFMQAGQFAEAIADFDFLLTKAVPTADLFQNRGICKFKMGDRAGATADLEQAARLAPTDAMIQKNLHLIRG